MSDARKTVVPTVNAYPVFNDQMTAINSDLDSVAKKRDHSVSSRDRIVGLLELVYVFRSCHWSMSPVVVRACRLLVTVGRPVVLLAFVSSLTIVPCLLQCPSTHFFAEENGRQLCHFLKC